MSTVSYVYVFSLLHIDMLKCRLCDMSTLMDYIIGDRLRVNCAERDASIMGDAKLVPLGIPRPIKRVL